MTVVRNLRKNNVRTIFAFVGDKGESPLIAKACLEAIVGNDGVAANSQKGDGLVTTFFKATFASGQTVALSWLTRVIHIPAETACCTLSAGCFV